MRTKRCFIIQTTPRVEGLCRRNRPSAAWTGRASKDKDFYRLCGDDAQRTPPLKVYEQYARTWGHKAKPASTASVQG